jgi:hypothetical protein
MLVPQFSTSYLVLIPLRLLAELAAALLPVNLAAVKAAHLVRLLARPPTSRLLACSALAYQRALGLGFLVLQLLVLRQSGASVYLRNASRALRHCLHKLNISFLNLLAE